MSDDEWRDVQKRLQLGHVITHASAEEMQALGNRQFSVHKLQTRQSVMVTKMDKDTSQTMSRLDKDISQHRLTSDERQELRCRMKGQVSQQPRSPFEKTEHILDCLVQIDNSR